MQPFNIPKHAKHKIVINKASKDPKIKSKM